MPSLRELETELGLTEGTLTAKADVATKWNGYFTAGETQMSEAQRKLDEAKQMQALIDQNIESFGMTEANIAELRASNAAMKAALEEVKKAGFSGINIPEFKGADPKAVDPVTQLQSTIVNGFTSMTQAFDAGNRYQRVFGKVMPDTVETLAAEARARRMEVGAYAEQKYGFAQAEQNARQEAERKQQEEWKAAGAKEYQEKHPHTAGNPELNGGGTSRFPTIPKPRDGKSVRDFSSLSARDKIASAMTRARENATSMAGAA